jgi:3-oxoacid CoA-transferase
LKQVPQISIQQAVAMVKPGDTLLVGGFGMTGYPVHLVHALAETGVGGLTYVANNVGGSGSAADGSCGIKHAKRWARSSRAIPKPWPPREWQLEVMLIAGSLAEALRAAARASAASSRRPPREP